MTTTRPIAVIGNANLDLIGGVLSDWPDRGTEVFLDHADSRVGGSAANTALVLQRLGARSGLIASAGTDTDGQMIADAFTGPLDRIARIAGPSSVSFGVLHPGSERSFFSTPGHLDSFDVEQVRSGLKDWPLNGAYALVSGAFAMPGLTEDCLSLMADLKAQGARVAIDPGWPGDGWTVAMRGLMQDWIAQSALVLINDKELLGMTGADTLKAAISKIAPTLPEKTVLVVKCGPNGAIALANGQRFAASSPKAEIFDTIGAGDAFNAGYLAAAQAGHDVASCLSAGCAIASAVIRAFPRAKTALHLPELLSQGASE